jgi:DNA-binding SARP family transcriptional activator
VIVPSPDPDLPFFSLLGPLDVRVGVRSLRLGGGGSRSLLATLLLNANRVVSTDRLIEAIWGETPPRTAVPKLHGHVSALRRTFAAVTDDEVIVTRPPGYTVIVRPGQLDVETFETLVDEGLGLVTAAPEEAAAKLRAALDLWRGPPLDGLELAGQVAVESARLETRRLIALEARIEADLALGRDQELVAELEGLVAANPLRERLHAHLIRALHQAGRRAEAVEASRRTRRLLNRELGIEPGDELRRLESTVRAGERPEEDAGWTADPGRDPGAQPSIVLVPHPRNALFTGREDVLAELAETLDSARAVALCGIGGVGKSQVAVEYAHRFGERHRHVLWLSADGDSDMDASLAGAAQALGLPEASGSNPAAVAEAVRRWLARGTDWLLVLDNLDHVVRLGDWLPVARSGQLLVTCRSQATGGVARSLPLEPMTAAEGVDFLIRRARLLEALASGDPAAERLQHALEDIVDTMGGLPLALDQAGAHMEETGATPAEYLALYRDRRLTLLGRRGMGATDHPDSAAATILLSFERLRNANPGAASLLCLCAFLHPNDIPEELLRTRADCLEPALREVAADPYLLGEAVASLRSFSLVERHPDAGTLSVHRLVQDVLRDSLPESERRRLAEQAVGLVAGAFARVDGIATWAERHRLASHALTVSQLAARETLATAETADLLCRTGSYLRTLGQPARALPLLTRALTIAEAVHGPEHPEVAACLNALGSMHQDRGEYEVAESLHLRSLAIWERSLGADDLAVALPLNDLGTLYVTQGRYRDGEAALRRVLAIQERRLGIDDPAVGITLNNLGGHAHMAGRYEEADRFFTRALALRRRLLGPDHPTVANVLSNLGSLAYDRGHDEDAIRLFVEAERTYRLTFRDGHWMMGKALHGQALVLHRQRRLERSDELHQAVLALWRPSLGDDHPRVTRVLSSLARLRDDQGRHEEAEALHEQAVETQERTLGTGHPDVAASLLNLARHHSLLGRRERAVATAESACAIRRAALGAEHPETVAAEQALAAIRAGLPGPPA